MAAARRTEDEERLRSILRGRGLSDQAIDAAWPTWWSEEAASLPSARAELRFTMARLLGLSPRSLLGERVEFVWKDSGRFKHLATENDVHKSALTSFCVAAGRLLLRATAPGAGLVGSHSSELRCAMLGANGQVNLNCLLATCWGLGVPVVHMRVFPLEAKLMHAIVVESEGRHAIFLGRDAQYPAPTTFTLAHEMGHVALGHMSGAAVLVDDDAAPQPGPKDSDETAADGFALELLTGEARPDIRTNVARYSGRQLADAARRSGALHDVEPGTLVLCLAHRTGDWSKAMAALPYIYRVRHPVWRLVNGVAQTQLEWAALSDDNASYLRKLMGIDDE